MAPETVNTLLIAVFSAAILGAAAYFIARYLKGSIRITLPRDAFSPGEQVEGSFELEAKKEIRANELLAALVASERYTERDHRGRRRTRTREIYRDKRTIEGPRVYPAGYKGNHNFKIALPAGGVGGGTSLLGGALGVSIGFGTRVEWRVLVQLDAEGVDLSSSKSIRVG